MKFLSVVLVLGLGGCTTPWWLEQGYQRCVDNAADICPPRGEDKGKCLQSFLAACERGFKSPLGFTKSEAGF